jgi:hypothetical protein
VPESEDPDEVTKDAIEVIVNTGHEQVTSEYDIGHLGAFGPRYNWLAEQYRTALHYIALP